MGFIIYLFGPSAAGKSTTAELLQKSISGLDVIDFDVIKRRIPNYDWTQHANRGKSMTLDALRLNGLTENNMLLLMPSPKNKQEFDLIRAIADARHYTLLNIELTAPQDVLVGRYRDRLANIDPSKKDWKFKTLDEFKTKLKQPYYLPDGTISFDSSLNSPDEIVQSIIKLTTPLLL